MGRGGRGGRSSRRATADPSRSIDLQLAARELLPRLLIPVVATVERLRCEGTIREPELPSSMTKTKRQEAAKFSLRPLQPCRCRSRDPLSRALGFVESKYNSRRATAALPPPSASGFAAESEKEAGGGGGYCMSHQPAWQAACEAFVYSLVERREPSQLTITLPKSP